MASPSPHPSSPQDVPSEDRPELSRSPGAASATRGSPPHSLSFSIKTSTLLLAGLVFLLNLGLILIVMRESRLGQANLPASATQRIDINTADASQLALLPGIGPSKAEAIVDYRRFSGPFQQIDELTSVSGIGEITITRIEPWIYCGPAAEE